MISFGGAVKFWPFQNQLFVICLNLGGFEIRMVPKTFL